MNSKKEILFLGNYTQDFISRTFLNLSKINGLSVNVHVSGFNQYSQDILDNESILYKLNLDIVFISIDLFTLTEDLIYDTAQNKLELFKKRLEEEVFSLLKIISKKLPKIQVFIDNFCYLRSSTMATIEYNSVYSYMQLEDLANLELYETVMRLDSINIVDVRSMVIREGVKKLTDNRLYYLAKSHWSHIGLKKLSELYFRYLNAFIGKRKKCIVLDLDNTIWGGIIGDDGIENITLSNEGEGKAFYDFQRELLKLYQRGIILAINSMNTREIVLESMNNHPYMILKPEHFVSIKIDWRNKAQKMTEIAEEINISTDSFVFLDDSDFEREIITKEFPEIFVPKLPVDYADYPDFIRNMAVFDHMNITKDDLNRNKSYKANTAREILKSKVINIEDFYYSLNMKAKIGRATSRQIPRIAQMTQKTNQFNLRTIRYTDADIKEFISSPDYLVYYLSLSDKFGDNGIVGTTIIKIEGKQAFIDSFIFSCRALGRTAETALINFIINDVIEKGAEILVGEYLETNKNSPCKEFYSKHCFKSRHSKWFLELENHEKNNTPWIVVNN